MKRPMRRYSPDDLPVVCLDCLGRLRWVPDRFSWQHVDRERGLDHAPRVTGEPKVRAS